VQLDVLPVADVGGVARELGRDLGDSAQLPDGQAPPSERTRIMKNSSSSSLGSKVAVRPPSIPGRRWV
jgi:hypothetical protein